VATYCRIAWFSPVSASKDVICFSSAPPWIETPFFLCHPPIRPPPKLTEPIAPLSFLDFFRENQKFSFLLLCYLSNIPTGIRETFIFTFLRTVKSGAYPSSVSLVPPPRHLGLLLLGKLLAPYPVSPLFP